MELDTEPLAVCVGFITERKIPLSFLEDLEEALRLHTAYEQFVLARPALNNFLRHMRLSNYSEAFLTATEKGGAAPVSPGEDAPPF